MFIKLLDELSGRENLVRARSPLAKATLGVPTVFDSLTMHPIYEELDELPSADEVLGTVQNLANNKSPGESGILPEMLKHAGPDFQASLLCLVHKVWQERSVPQAWRDAEIVPIPKKGDLICCDNWHRIALLDVVGKLVGRLVQN